MVSGKLEVDGGIYDDSLMGNSLAKAYNGSNMPVMNTGTAVNVLCNTEEFDIGSNWASTDVYGASGAYRQADDDSDATHIEDDDAVFSSTVLGVAGFGNWVQWASNAAGTEDVGEGYAAYSDADTLTLYKSSGTDFNVDVGGGVYPRYYWIRVSSYTVPVAGYYEIILLGCLNATEDGGRFNIGYNVDASGQTLVSGAMSSYAASTTRLNGSAIAHFAVGNKIRFNIQNINATAATVYPSASNNYITIRCIKLD
jgi:hypothetical protein